jgi:transcriptional regulator with XRE-family HTH domain
VEERAYPGENLPQVREIAEEKKLTLDDLSRRYKLDIQDIRDVAAGRVTRVAIKFFPTLRKIADGLEADYNDVYPPEWVEWAEKRLLGDNAQPLKVARIRAGITIGELAENANTQAWHISRLEHGELPWQRFELARPHLHRLAAAFGSHYTRMFGHLLDNPQPKAATSRVQVRPAKVKLPEGWPDLWNWRAEKRLTRRGLASSAKVTITNLKQLELGRPIPVKSITVRNYADRLGKILGKPKSAIATPVVVQACAEARKTFVAANRAAKGRD